jgi:hypothetical protein
MVGKHGGEPIDWGYVEMIVSSVMKLLFMDIF